MSIVLTVDILSWRSRFCLILALLFNFAFPFYWISKLGHVFWKTCPYLEFFWSLIRRIRTEYEDLRSNSDTFDNTFVSIRWSHLIWDSRIAFRDLASNNLWLFGSWSHFSNLTNVLKLFTTRKKIHMNIVLKLSNRRMKARRGKALQWGNIIFWRFNFCIFSKPWLIAISYVFL